MEKMMRQFFLFLSNNEKISGLAKKHGLKFGAKRFVSGETLQSAIEVTKNLNEKNIMTTLDHLGEYVSSEEEAKQSTNDCINTLEAIHTNGLNANLSLKLTQLGLDLSLDVCLKNMRKILEKAKERNLFVRIDMEDYSRNSKTLEIFRKLKNEFPENVGVVIQAYLYKSIDDVLSLGKLDSNLRLCKGAYKEPIRVAYQEKQDVDENYLKIIEKHLLGGHYAGIATHDEKVIHHVVSFVKENNIPNSQFEFQMLYGIKNDVLEKLANDGYQTRVYVPYGNDWYGYFMRRLAERPENVMFVLKNLRK